MKYIKNVDAYKDKKKVISARVSEVVVKALEMAKPELPSRFDLTFSYPEIIEKALEDALEEMIDRGLARLSKIFLDAW